MANTRIDFCTSGILAWCTRGQLPFHCLLYRPMYLWQIQDFTSSGIPHQIGFEPGLQDRKAIWAIELMKLPSNSQVIQPKALLPFDFFVFIFFYFSLCVQKCMVLKKAQHNRNTEEILGLYNLSSYSVISLSSIARFHWALCSSVGFPIQSRFESHLLWYATCRKILYLPQIHESVQ